MKNNFVKIETNEQTYYICTDKIKGIKRCTHKKDFGWYIDISYFDNTNLHNIYYFKDKSQADKAIEQIEEKMNIKNETKKEIIMKTKEEIIELLRTDVQAFNAYRQDLFDEGIYDLDLSRVDLSSANLSYANLECAILYYVKLSFSNLSGANLSNSNLYYAILRGANLKNANLNNASLENADLWDADLRNANLSYVNLSNANLRGANLTFTGLRNANLKGTNLWDAKLDITKLSDTNLDKKQNKKVLCIQMDALSEEDIKQLNYELPLCDGEIVEDIDVDLIAKLHSDMFNNKERTYWIEVRD